jgi:hypothetical protein
VDEIGYLYRKCQQVVLQQQLLRRWDFAALTSSNRQDEADVSWQSKQTALLYRNRKS